MSVYRYFPDKYAIAEALALRHWDGFATSIERLAEEDEREPVADPVTAILEVLSDGFRAAPAFRALWYSPLRTQQLRDATRPTRERFAASLARMLAARWPHAGPQLREQAARTVVLVGDGLLREAFRVDPHGDAALLAEARIVLNAYLDARLGPRS